MSLAPLTPRCGSVTGARCTSGSLWPSLLPSCKPHAPSRTCSFKASARCPTFSPHGCCFCFVLPRAAVIFCGPCHLWLRPPLRKPMTRLSPPALRICWGPARSRTTRSALPSSLSSKVASTCGLRSPSLRPRIGPRGPTLFPCCTASSRASPPTLLPGLEPASPSALPSEACFSHRQRLLRPGLTCPHGMP